MKTMRSKIPMILTLFALALASCAPSSALAAQLTPSPTPTAAPTSMPAPTDVPPGGGNLGGGGSANTVTRDNDNQTVTLHVGETFLLKLGNDYDWSPVIDDQSIISRIPNIAVIAGAQGIYLAHKAGTATMTATGDPPCRQSKPPCMVASVVFRLNIQVLP